jgi:hypothetical protein
MKILDYWDAKFCRLVKSYLWNVYNKLPDLQI